MSTVHACPSLAKLIKKLKHSLGLRSHGNFFKATMERQVSVYISSILAPLHRPALIPIPSNDNKLKSGKQRSWQGSSDL
jgi:hypothetical protein